MNYSVSQHLHPLPSSAMPLALSSPSALRSRFTSLSSRAKSASDWLLPCSRPSCRSSARAAAVALAAAASAPAARARSRHVCHAGAPHGLRRCTRPARPRTCRPRLLRARLLLRRLQLLLRALQLLLRALQLLLVLLLQGRAGL